MDLPVGDGPHEGRLSGTILTAQTVAVATLETECGSVEEDLGTVSQRELAVAKVFAFFFIFWDFIVLCAFSRRTDNPLTSCIDRFRDGGNEAQEGSKSIPLGNVKVLGVDEVGSKVRGVHGGDVSNGDL
jgi:hypothetical protein